MQIETGVPQLVNEHPSFHIRALLAVMPDDAPLPGQAETEAYVARVRERLIERFGTMTRAELKQLPMLAPYIRYFKSFKKSYHLLLQLESFVHKGRGIPFVNPLLTAYFLTELESGVLASAHDAGLLQPPLRLVRSSGGETLTLLSGEQRSVHPGDAALYDTEGLLTVVTQGQDRRSALQADSRSALWVFYAPLESGAELAEEEMEERFERAMELCADHLRGMGGGAARFTPLRPE